MDFLHNSIYFTMFCSSLLPSYFVIVFQRICCFITFSSFRCNCCCWFFYLKSVKTSYTPLCSFVSYYLLFYGSIYRLAFFFLSSFKLFLEFSLKNMENYTSYALICFLFLPINSFSGFLY